MTKKNVPGKKRGRPEKPLKIDGDWKDAVKRALKRGRPPKPGSKKRRPP